MEFIVKNIEWIAPLTVFILFAIAYLITGKDPSEKRD